MRHYKFRNNTVASLAAALKRGFLIGALVACVASAAAAQTASDWTAAGGQPQGTNYSVLNDITSANVGTLVEEFSYPTGTKGTHEGAPIVVGSTMYVVTTFPNKLIALDLARPGKVLWTFEPHPAAYAKGLTCCDIVNRGAAYANGLVVYTLLDGNVVAVNARTGEQAWRTKVAEPWTGETLNTAPIIVNNKVIFGSSGSENGVRGSVRALDLTTGAPLWQAYSTGPDKEVLIDSNFRPYYAKDRGVDLGVKSWPGSLWRQGGATTWAWITYDPELNLIFYGTSQPGTWNPDMRPGDNKWGSSIFARNPDTGKAVWAYQLVPHDNWDFDATNEYSVVDLRINGVLRKVIVHFNKNGFTYVLDRATGELISANPFAFANWATGVDLTTGAPQVVDSYLTHQGVVTTNICPSTVGAKSWEWSAFNPGTRLFYFGAHNLCMNYEALEVLFIAGTPINGAAVHIFPGAGGNMGEFVAYDPVAGRRAWTIKEPLPAIGGALATAGNLIFYGTLDRQFKAVDATTGEIKFSVALECGVASAPIAFKGADGKQRVAITTGIGWVEGAFAGGPCPAGSTSAEDEGAENRSRWTVERSVQDIGANLVKPTTATTTAITSGYVHVFKLP